MMNIEAAGGTDSSRTTSLGNHIKEFVNTVKLFHETNPDELQFSQLEKVAPHLPIRETRLAHRISEILPKKK